MSSAHRQWYRLSYKFCPDVPIRTIPTTSLTMQNFTTQQPPSNSGMTLSASQDVMVISEKEWSTSVFRAGNPCTGLCWYYCLCPCLAQQQNYERFEYLASGGANVSIDPAQPNCIGGCCVIQAILCHTYGVQAILPCILRIKTRKLLRIRGSVLKDCLASVCMMPNVIGQTTLELQEQISRLQTSRGIV